MSFGTGVATGTDASVFVEGKGCVSAAGRFLSGLWRKYAVEETARHTTMRFGRRDVKLGVVGGWVCAGVLSEFLSFG